MSRRARAAVAAAWLTLFTSLAGGGVACAQAAPAQAATPPSPFAGWAAVFVAGDWRGHNGGPTEAFDNARRDLAEAFVAAGFSRQNIREFSTRPERYPGDDAFPSQYEVVRGALDRLTREATAGCLVYVTSHGSPDGALVGPRLLAPRVAARMLDETCGDRPTVAVISACYSGVFVPELAAPNRMVLTAARPDRSSFGCGESDKYPYFDACVLEALPQASDFAALGRAAIACVARREKQEGLTPPSEPQMAIGGDLRPELPLMPLRRR